jgi:hypothetical protein
VATSRFVFFPPLRVVHPRPFDGGSPCGRHSETQCVIYSPWNLCCRLKGYILNFLLSLPTRLSSAVALLTAIQRPPRTQNTRYSITSSRTSMLSLWSGGSPLGSNGNGKATCGNPTSHRLLAPRIQSYGTETQVWTYPERSYLGIVSYDQRYLLGSLSGYEVELLFGVVLHVQGFAFIPIPFHQIDGHAIRWVNSLSITVPQRELFHWVR